MKAKIPLLFLGILGALLAAPTQKDAQNVFTQNLNKGRYSIETFSGYPPGVIRYWINRITWGESYTQSIMGEDWTVFVANAVVSGGPDHQHYERYSLKAGIALIQRGDEIFVREPFDPVIGDAPTLSAEELKKEEERAKAEQEAQQESEQKQAAIAKRKKLEQETAAEIAATIQKQTVALSSDLILSASVDDMLSPNVTIDKGRLGFSRYRFKDALSVGNLPAWISALQKWKDWSQKARDNQIKSVRKEVARFGGFPSISVQLDVDDKGVVSLLLSGQLDDDLLLSDEESAKLMGALEKLQGAITAAQSAISAAVDKKLAEANKADDVFKD